jgi:hypothetical protein
MMDAHVIDWYSPLYIERENPHVRFKLSAVQLRSQGRGYVFYLIDKYHLDILDILVLSAMLDVSVDQIPVVAPTMSTSEGDDDVSTCEEGTPSPSIPGDWGPDNHTVGPGSGWPRGRSEPPPYAQQPSRGVPRRPQQPRPGWRPKLHPPPPDSVNGNAHEDWLDGVSPGDRPTGLYPGSDDPHECPSMTRGVFLCRGKVYLGCKSLCPDYSLSESERWAQAWNDAGKQWGVVDRLKEMQHSPNCYDECVDLGAVPLIISAVCLTANLTWSIPFPAAPWLAALDKSIAFYCDTTGLLRAAQVSLASGAGVIWSLKLGDWCRAYCTPHRAQQEDEP